MAHQRDLFQTFYTQVSLCIAYISENIPSISIRSIVSQQEKYNINTYGKILTKDLFIDMQDTAGEAGSGS